jgi:hypothetical protein
VKADIQDMEQIVLLGLEYEVIEKEKAYERKALTRKNGLNKEEAKYNDGIKGQTRDIVAQKLGMSGRQWERVRFIYQHKDCLSEEEYIAWRKGEVSTYKQYNELCKQIRYTKNIDKILDDLFDVIISVHNYGKSCFVAEIRQELQYVVYPFTDKKKSEIFDCFDRLIKYNQDISEQQLEKLYDISDSVQKIRKELSFINK